MTKNVKHKCLVKVRSFGGAKVRCMYDHSKPTLREFNPEKIIVHVGTNDLNSCNKSSKIARSIISLAKELKNEENEIIVSLIVPRNDNLNNKVNEVNDRLRHLCDKNNFRYIDHTDTIIPEEHLYGNLHLNRSGVIEIARNFTLFLNDLYWYNYNGSDSISYHQGNEKNNQEYRSIVENIDNERGISDISDVSQNSIRWEHEDSNFVNETESLINKSFLDPHSVLKTIRSKNLNRLIIAQLNINSLRNKFDSLVQIFDYNIDILLVSETKIDSSFPSAQFYIDRYTIFRRDRNSNGGGMILYIKDDIPANILNTNASIESFYVEINIRKKNGW